MKRNQFPWQKLPESLANEGIIIENYPHTIQLPGIKTGKQTSKGINDLNKQEVKDLYEALGSKDFPLRFRVLPDEAIGESIAYIHRFYVH